MSIIDLGPYYPTKSGKVLKETDSIQKIYVKGHILNLVSKMSVEEFVQEIREEHKEKLGDVEKLLKTLEKIEERETEIYQFFITSNL